MYLNEALKVDQMYKREEGATSREISIVKVAPGKSRHSEDNQGLIWNICRANNGS